MCLRHEICLGPVMGEVLRNSIPVDINFMHGNCQVRTCCRVCGGSAMKVNRTRVAVCELNKVLISFKVNSWFGCVQLKMPRTSLSFGSTRMQNLYCVSNAVASDDSRLVYQDKDLVQIEEEKLDVDSSPQILPPWGKLTVCHRSDDGTESDYSRLVCKESQGKDLVQIGEDEHNVDSLPQIFPAWGHLTDCHGSDDDTESVVQSPTLPENRITVDESRLLLLEETDEEKLSRRILKLSRSNKVRSGLELFRSMELSGLRANGHACNSLLSCLLRNKLVDSALRVFEFMKTNEIETGHTHSLIFKAVADTQGCDSALKMFAELEGSPIGKKDFDVIVYNTMISVCGRVNNWLETERLWRSMIKNGHHGTLVTYSLLVSIFVRCGQSELALDAYNEMVKKGLKPGDDVLQAVIGACAKEGKWDLALNIFQNMLNLGMKPRLVTCNALINSLGKAGQITLVFTLFEIVKSLGHTPDEYTWNALLCALYRANQHTKVLELFETIKSEEGSQLNEHLYNTALMSCQKLGLWDKSLQFLWQLESSGLPVSTASFNLVIGACEIARRPKVALQVYEHMVHQKCAPDTFTFLSLLRSCIWASLWDEVDEILDLIEPDVSIYNAVIHGMCLRGKLESAKKLYLKMRNSGLKPDGKTRALMLQNLQRKVQTKRRRLSARAR